MNAVRFPVLMFHLNGHVNKTWRNRKTFLIWYSVALLLARENFQHVSVFHEHVYGEHCMKTACTHFTHSLCKIYTQGTLPLRLEFCHWLHTNRQLLPLILFTVATFTRNGISNTRNSHRWSHENPHGTAETNFQRRFSINVWCGMIDDMLIGPVILDDRVTEQNNLDFLQNELPNN